MVKKLIICVLICAITVGLMQFPVSASETEVPNLALGKATTAYSYQHGAYDYYVTDGNYNTWWTRANPGDEMWVQVDLGAQYQITSVELVPRQDSDIEHYRKDFVLLLSNTADFSGEVVKYEMDSAPVAYMEHIIFETNGLPFRYVRIQKPKESGTNIAHVAEIEVYSDLSALKKEGLSFNDVEKGTDLHGALSLLNAIGACPEGSEFNQENLMTRATAVSLIVQVFNGEVTNGKTTSAPVFLDVDESNQYFDTIQTAYALGYITGVGDSRFRPNDYVTRVDFLLMTLRAMGYDTSMYAEPIYYIQAVIKHGKKLDLEENTSSGEYYDFLKRGDAYIIMANAITKPQAEIIYSAAGGYTAVGRERESLLESMYKMTLHEGIVQENKKTSLIDEKKVANDTTKAVVGGKTFDDSENMLKDSLGKQVTVGTYEDNPNKIVVFWESPENSEIVIDASDLDCTESDIRSNVIKAYDSSDKSRRYTLSEKYDVVYNGVVQLSYKPSDLIIENGDITLLDNNDDKRFDVVFVNEYTVHRLMSVFVQDERLALTDSEGQRFTFDEENVTYYNYLGNAEKLKRLKANQVVKLYTSADGDVVRIVECKKLENRVIEATSGDNFTLSGVEYEFAYEKDNIPGMFSLGDTVTVFLDDSDRILWMTKAEEVLGQDWIIGFFQGHKQESGFDEPLYSRVFTQYNKWEVYPYAKKVKLDGVSVSVKELKDILMKNANGFYTLNFMCFKLNSNNEIAELDSLNRTEHEEDTSMNYSVENRVGREMYSKASGSFWLNHTQTAKIENKSPVFVLPVKDDGNSSTVNGDFWTGYLYDDYYQVYPEVVNVTTNLNIKNQDIDLYMQNPETGFFKFAAQRREYADLQGTYDVVTDPAAPSLLVEEVSTVYDQADETVYIEISGYNVLTQQKATIYVEQDAILVEHGLYYQEFITAPTNGVATQYLGNEWQMDGILLAKTIAANPELESALIKSATDIGFGDIIRYQTLNGRKTVTAVDRVFDYDENQLPEQKRASWLCVGSTNVATYIATYYYQFADLSKLTDTTYSFRTQYRDETSGEYSEYVYMKNMLTKNFLCDPYEKTIKNISDLSPYEAESYRHMLLNSGGTPRSAIVYLYK